MQLFLTAFESVPDPRAENSRHDLVEILLVAFLAVLCGAQHCSEMAEFGRAKLKFLTEGGQTAKWLVRRASFAPRPRPSAILDACRLNDQC